jgi:hypothetical protein
VEHGGIPCCHILAVHKFAGRSIIESYLKERWSDSQTDVGQNESRAFEEENAWEDERYQSSLKTSLTQDTICTGF